MNSRRSVMWIGFLGVSAALAWAPGHWFEDQQGVAPQAQRADSHRPALAPLEASLPRDEASAPRDLFPSQQWTAPQQLATVTEAPPVVSPVIVAPTAPALPFQFVGRLGDRDDLQVFLQDGEKLYVVRQGDVIEDTYRLDHVSANELGLVYLPLHQLQTLSVGSAP
ncbi:MULTISPECIES: hypothetical protein [Pseudomonas]|uniref:Secretion system X translation initiation factor n=1 Tax=Pseudomonas mosselii TaxID=78327 RepID=A0A5R8ZHV1_9PSED|nr:hypothetical protein [Pseudomonas mosselii]TLP65348.1 hypothetical protein FEM01_04015 [Pseudomonas mosselii]